MLFSGISVIYGNDMHVVNELLIHRFVLILPVTKILVGRK